MALAEVSGSSIIADETVEGRATYFFSNTDLETALDQFLGHYGIFYRLENGTYYVSRIEVSQQNGMVSCRAEQADIQLVIRRLSRELGITILHDALPRDTIDLNFQQGDLQQLLEIIIRPYPLFYLEEGDQYYYLRKEMTSSGGGLSANSGRELYSREGELFTADLRQVRFREALISLFEAQGVEFSFLGRNDNVIEIFRHSGKTFEEILDLLMEQGNGGYQLSNGIYYVFDRDRQDILKEYFTTIYLPLENTDVDLLQTLLPSALSNTGDLKLDKENNGVILFGNLQDIAPLEDFIRSLDQPMTDREYQRYDLNFISFEDLNQQLGPEFSGVNFIGLDNRSFICSLSLKKHEQLTEYLALIDQRNPAHPVTLRYINWEQLQDNIPPSISQEQVTQSSNPNLIFFTGSQGELDHFLMELEHLDQPKPQIRYELLVLEVTEDQGLGLNNQENQTLFDTSYTGADASTGIAGAFSGLTSLTFDVINQFGYQFSLNLSANLTDNTSRILTDTTLYGLSGEQVTFQNTNTSRHPTTREDPDGEGTETTGFKEITSGLMIDVTGWTSGDGMVTMEIKSTISNQEGGSDSDANSIPSTSEKVITTHVRSLSGEPIVLSGLKHRQLSIGTSRVPFLGRIPLLGLLFQSRTETFKDSEFLVTLIPYVEEDPQYQRDPYEDLYDRFLRRDHELR